MNIPKVLLDTDILSKVLRGEPLVLAQATAYLQQHTKFTFSLITQYEILRGLKAKTALVQLQRFQQFCVSCEILPLTEEIIFKASDIYAELYRRGELVGDVDILIGATAIVHDLLLNTNNVKHFHRIPLLRLENWSQAVDETE